MLRTNWAPLRASIQSEHVFAIGDIHGHAEPLQQALETIARTPDQGRPKRLVFLGDTIDRGPENVRSAELVQNAPEITGISNVDILIGNHEIMLSEAIKHPDDQMMFWSTVGGHAVLQELDPDEEYYQNKDLAELLRSKLPDYLTQDLYRMKNSLRIDDLVFVHAGLSPVMDIKEFLSLSYSDAMPGGLHWAWIRDPFLEWTGGWNDPDPICVVHGHSSMTEKLFNDTDEIKEAAMLHDTHSRINLDAGAGAFISQIAMGEFLNGSYRVHAFQDENFKS